MKMAGFQGKAEAMRSDTSKNKECRKSEGRVKDGDEKKRCSTVGMAHFKVGVPTPAFRHR
jgi:hypothetical protein